MAEKKYNDLYNQLNPMDRRYYDQQFSEMYTPGQENIMLSSQPSYEQMKAIYEAQQQIPEKSFLDRLNLFGSASAAEKPKVPNLSLGYNVPTFDLGTGITNTTAASPFKIGLEDILDQYNVPNLQSRDLVQQLIEESTAPVTSSVMYDEFPEGFNFTPQAPSQKFQFLPEAYNQSEDVEQVESLTEEAPSQGLESLRNLIPGSLFGNLLSGIFGKDPPEVRRVKDFYAGNFGVNKAGSVASGIMQGYNPVSGGFLNRITGGRFGEPMQVGLGRAIQNRISNILGRKLPQTEASRRKVEELRNLQLQEMRDRAAGGESLGSIGKSTFSGKGGAFEAKNKGTFTTPSGQKGYYGGR